MMEIRIYEEENGNKPYLKWLADIDRHARNKVLIAISRLKDGNTSNVKSIGNGVSEVKITFGAGFRVYFGYENSEIVILLGGGTKKRQDKDIKIAKSLWKKYQEDQENGNN